MSRPTDFIRAMDKNGDNVIDYAEFAAGARMFSPPVITRRQHARRRARVSRTGAAQKRR